MDLHVPREGVQRARPARRPAVPARVRVRVRVGVGPSLARGGSPEQLDELALLELAALVGVVLVEDLIEPLLLLDVCLR